MTERGRVMPVVCILTFSVDLTLGFGIRSGRGLFTATGATAGRAASAGGTRSALELSAAREGEGGHLPADLLRFALRAADFLRRVKNQFFKLVVALVTHVFVNWHLSSPQRSDEL